MLRFVSIVDAAIRMARIEHRRIMLILLAGIFAAGCVYAVLLGNVVRFADEDWYLNLSRNLIFHHMFSTDGLVPTTTYAPGWPIILSPFIGLGLSITALRLVSVFFLIGSIWLAYRFLRERGFPEAGVLAAVLMACDPVFFFTAGTFYAQTCGTFLFLMGLNLVLTPRVHASWMYAVGGLLLGMLILAIPMFVFSVALIVTRLFFFSPRVGKFRIALLALFIVLVVGSWIVRNYIHTGRFIFIASYAEANLIQGNSEMTTAGSGANTDMSQLNQATQGMSDVEKRAYYRARVIDWFTHHKLQAARLYFAKLLYYFSPINRLAQRNEQSSARDALLIVTFIPLLTLFLIRLFRWRRFPPFNGELLFVLLYFFSAFCYAVFAPRIRFRLPFDALLIIVVGNYLIQWWDTRFNTVSPQTVSEAE